MIDNDLKVFIKEQRSKGLADRQIEDILISHGWKVDDVRVVFDAIDLNVPLPKTQPSEDNNTNNNRNGIVADVTPKEGSRLDIWDAFENVIMFITMGCVAVSIGLLLNYFIDEVLLVDIIQQESWARYPGSNYNSQLATGYASVLFVALPIFTVLFLRISKRTKENPALKNKLVRKVLTYITMVISSVIVIINLISVVYRLLAGELGVEDFFDFVIIVGISSIVFYYFLTQTKEDRKK